MTMLPCPHCGAKDARHASKRGGDSFVYCGTCKAEGAPADTHVGAVAAWNRRTSPPRPPDLTTQADAEIAILRSDEHPADTAILRLMDETGASYLRCEAYRTAGAPPRMKMTAHLDRDVVRASGAGWSETMGALGDELRARGMLPPERLDGGGR